MHKRRKVESYGSHEGEARGRLVRFTECQLVRDGQLVHEDLWVLDGQVVDPQARWWDAANDAAFLGETTSVATRSTAALATAAAAAVAAGPANASVAGGVCGSGGQRYEVVRCDGHILAPGFYDLQLNGAFGVDFANPEHVTLDK
jgi:hypothetical protein